MVAKPVAMGKAKAKAKGKAKATAKAKAVTKAKAAPKAAGGGRALPGSFGAVAPSSGLAGQGRILKDGGENYDVDLNLSDSSKNMNKFYRMQIVESNDKTKYWFVQHWGRIGTTGQTQVKGPFSKDAAIKALKSKFRSKAGVAFEARGAAAPGSTATTGKYELTSRLTEAKAKRATVAGSLSFSLMWDNMRKDRLNDLDLHVKCPSGEVICYTHKKSKCGGHLDVDRMQNDARPVENIVWTKKAPKGTYEVSVVNFSTNHSNSVPFEVGIVKDGGEMRMMKKTMPAPKKGNSLPGTRVQVTKFTN